MIIVFDSTNTPEMTQVNRLQHEMYDILDE